MPEFIRIEPDENRIKDVGIIENCVHTLMTARQRKNRTMAYHIIYVLLTALVGYISIDCHALGVGGFLGLICLFAYPALYVYTMLYSPTFLKGLGAALPLLGYSMRFWLFPIQGEGFIGFAEGAIGYFMCLAAAAVMCKAATGKHTKLWCMVAVTCCVVLTFCALGAVYAMYYLGGIDVEKTLGLLNDGISAFSKSFGDNLALQLSDSEMFAALSAAIPEISQMTPQQAGAHFEELLKTSLGVIKMLIPGLFVFVCMIYAFVFTAVFSLTARLQKIPLFVCIMDVRWCYRIPASCITFFDIILLLLIISNIFGLPANVALTVINLLIILLPVVTVSTFKAIHFFIYGKLHSKSAAYVICTLIAFVPLTFLGMWGLLLVCSVGVSLVAQRYRIEGMAAKEKIKLDTEAMLVLCGCKEPSELKNVFNTQEVSDENGTVQTSEQKNDGDETDNNSQHKNGENR